MSPFKIKKDHQSKYGVTIDWDSATKGAYKKLDDYKDNWDKKLECAKLIVEIERFRISDDAEGYLKLLDDNRNLITG